MKIQYYRYFLNVSDQQAIFEDKKRNKRDILLEVLDKKYHFQHKVSTLGFSVIKIEGNFVYARYGKRSKIKKSLSPENNFKDQTEENWPYRDVFINLDQNDKENGQIIGFEWKPSVFENPLIELNVLANEMNAFLTKGGWVMSINPISSTHDFWQLVDSNKGGIEALTFSFLAPNLFDLQNKLGDDLATLQKVFGITDTSLSLENKEGNLIIPKDNELIKQGADYVSKGAGEYILKFRGNKKYSSKSKVKERNVTLGINLETSDKSAFMEAIKRIFQW